MKTKRKQELDAPTPIPEHHAQWDKGVLKIDGKDARHIVAEAEARGMLHRGIEVYPRDNVPITNHGRTRKKFFSA